MKRLTTLLLTVVFVLGCGNAALADGITVKVKGQWDFAFGWASNTNFEDSVHGFAKERSDDNFIARHRVRTQVNFIASESLQGVLMFEIGDLNWGRGYNSTRAGRSTGGGLDADGVNIETKFAYLDWVIPNTEVSMRMGLQRLILPSTRMGSPVFAADVAGIVAQAPVSDMISVTGFWVRPFDYNANDGSRSLADEVDAFGLLLPVKGDGWAVTPWGMYAFVGGNSGILEYMFENNSNPVPAAGRGDNSHAKAWWAGLHFDLSMLDPLTFGFDAAYGALNAIDASGMGLGASGYTSEDISMRGWFLAATLDYKLDWGTPGIFGWYATGDKEDTHKTGRLGRMPVFGIDGGSFKPTSFGLSGTYGGMGTDNLISATGTGTWGVGLQLAELSFIDGLSHTLRVAYYQGTNDKDVVKHGGPVKYSYDSLYLTNKDRVLEVNFDHQYKIYENLTAMLELGYLHLKSDDNVWGGNGNNADEHDSAWKAQVLMRYSF